MATPPQDFLRGMGGRAVDPAHLEELGKAAAGLADSTGITLGSAVVRVIGREKLSAEQVRRVVEFTNIEAFNKKFAALHGSMRAVHFDGGPADPVRVLQDLNDGARPKEVTMESMDYEVPPMAEKTSAMPSPDIERSATGILGDVRGLQRKLASAHDEIVQGAEAAALVMQETLDGLVGHIKRASMQGAGSNEILDAWVRVNPEVAKLAYARLRDVMVPGAKTAGRRIDPEHPVVGLFVEFVKAAQVHTAYRAALRSLDAELSKIAAWMQRQGDD
jgi:hypothetical protein